MSVKSLFTLSACALLAGCTSLGGRPEEPLVQYLLAPELPPAAAPAPEPRPVVAVAPATAQPAYNSARMVYTTTPFRIDHFAHNEWADSPARMLEPLVVRVLDRSGRFQVVGPGSATSLADYYVDTSLVLFRQEFTGGSSVGHMVLRVQIDQAGGSVLATRTFEAVKPAPGADPAGGVAALNAAAGELLEQLSAFVTETVASHPPPPR